MQLSYIICLAIPNTFGMSRISCLLLEAVILLLLIFVLPTLHVLRNATIENSCPYVHPIRSHTPTTPTERSSNIYLRIQRSYPFIKTHPGPHILSTQRHTKGISPGQEGINSEKQAEPDIYKCIYTAGTW